MVGKFFGYIQTVKNYLQTDKGQHDFVDYIRAGFLFLVTTLIINLILRLV